MTKTTPKEVIKAIAKVFEVSSSRVTLLESCGNIEGFGEMNDCGVQESEEQFGINIRYNGFLHKGYTIQVSGIKGSFGKVYVAHGHTVKEAEWYDNY